MRGDRLVDVLTDLPHGILGDYDLGEVMGSLGDDIADILEVAGAGVMLEDEAGHLRFVAASDPVLGRLEELQVELGEGPCLLAYRTGEEVHSEQLADDGRFPAFAAQAVEAGMASVFSLPLAVDQRRVGALNFYDAEPRSLSAEDLDTARTLAEVATVYLLHARDLSHYRTENAQLTHALDSRVVVEQAKGWLAARTGITPDEAWEAIRDHARSQQRRVHDVSRELLDGGDVGPIMDAHRT